jgi:hypothetical protein
MEKIEFVSKVKTFFTSAQTLKALAFLLSQY